MSRLRRAATIAAFGAGLAFLVWGLGHAGGALVQRAALRRPVGEWLVPLVGVFWLLVGCVALAFAAKRLRLAAWSIVAAVAVAMTLLGAGWWTWVRAPGPESQARALTPMPPDAELPELNARRGGVTYRTNSHGFRDRPWRPKPAGGKRIAVLGDSFVFGMGVDADSTLPVLLERALSPVVPGVEVVNLGVPGANLRTHADVLAATLDPVAPDVVVVCVTHNDFSGWNPAAEHAARRRIGWYSLTQFLVGESAAPWVRALFFGLATDASDEERLRTVELARLSELTREAGVPLVVFAYAPEDLEKLTPLREQALVTALPEVEPAYFIPDDGHPTAAGNTAFAAHLAPLVAEAIDSSRPR